MSHALDLPSVPVYRNHHELLYIRRSDDTVLLCRRCGKTAPGIDRFESITCDTIDAQVKAP